MQPLTPKFVNRIAAYPAPVRDALARPLDPEAARDALRVLHANPNVAAAQIEALCAPGDPADVFLAKMARSRRLMLRAGALHWALAALAPREGPLRIDPGLPEADLGPVTRAEAHALLAEETALLIAPMGDPDRPYLWKLSEIAAAEAEARDKAEGIAPPARATLLTGMVAVWRLMRGDGLTGTGAPETPPEPGVALARGMLVLAGAHGEAAARRVAAPLAAALAAAGLDLPLRGAAGKAPAVPAPEAVAYARVLLGGWLPSRADRAAEAALRAETDRKGVIALAEPRPLAVLPEGDGPRGHWAPCRELGLVDALIDEGAAAPEGMGVATVPAAWAPSGLLLAALRALPALASARGAVAFEGPDPVAPLSWERAIRGYPDTGAPVPLGGFRPAPAGGLRWPGGGAPGPLRIALDPPAALSGAPLDVPAAEDLPLRDAYALVLRLDAEAAPERHVNHDRCRAVPDLGRDAIAALAARVEAGDFDAVARAKPVVLASGDSADDPARLTDAVGRHWAYGGRYPTTDLAIDYDARAARFLPGLRAEAHLTRLIPAAAACLPLGALPGLLAAGAFDRLHLGLVLLPDAAMGVCVPPRGGGRTAEALQAARLAAMRRLSPDRVDVATQRRAAEAGPVTPGVAARRAGPGDWPIAALAAETAHRARRRRSRLAEIARDGAGMDAAALAAEAEALLAALPETELRAARDDLDAALMALAARPDALAAASEAGLTRILGLARTAPSVDALAARLAAAAPELVGDRTELVAPLMALLATGLAEGPLQAAWAALAVALAPGDVDHAPMRHRLGVTGRAHAGPEAMGRYLTFLATHVPHALDEDRLLRQFAELAGPSGPGHPVLAVASARAGRDMTAAIRRAADPRDLFRMAVAARDRDAALAVLADAERLSDVPVRDWMDSLRAYSNELRALALPVAGHVPPGGGVQRVKLMATVFQDAEALAELAAQGFLADGTSLSALALQVLGEPAALDAILAALAEGGEGDAGSGAIRLRGGTAAEAFRNAAADLAPAAARARGPEAPVTAVVSAYEPDPEMLAIALDGLRSQTRPPAEIFVVDDASGPAGRATIDAALARDPGLKLIRMDVNSGPYAGRNRVLAAMTGEYLAIQDADDWSHPDRLARQLAAFEAAPDRQLVTAPHIRVDAAGRVQMEAGFAIAGDGPMTSLFRRSAFDRVGPFAAVRSRGDVEMRERMRAYFGGHALHETARPMMLCFAASTTLSQRVRLHRREALQLLREHIDERPALDGLRAEGAVFDPAEVAVPHALRAPSEEAAE